MTAAQLQALDAAMPKRCVLCHRPADNLAGWQPSDPLLIGRLRPAIALYRTCPEHDRDDQAVLAAVELTLMAKVTS